MELDQHTVKAGCPGLLALNFVIDFKSFKLVFFKLNVVVHWFERGGFSLKKMSAVCSMCPVRGKKKTWPSGVPGVTHQSKFFAF